MTWSVHVPAGPCETFTERATDAITGNQHLTDPYRVQANAASDIAAQIIRDHLPGQEDTTYSASLSGHNSHGSAGFTVSVSASPVPK